MPPKGKGKPSTGLSSAKKDPLHPTLAALAVLEAHVKSLKATSKERPSPVPSKPSSETIPTGKNAIVERIGDIGIDDLVSVLGKGRKILELLLVRTHQHLVHDVQLTWLKGTPQLDADQVGALKKWCVTEVSGAFLPSRPSTDHHSFAAQ